ncbi:MAG: DUF2927 domain-containing protein [Chloroflexota bacterium]|jgi:hypothetical protein|nr:DUF2927 domain-containing protein [Chloroflexota bacterium]
MQPLKPCERRRPPADIHRPFLLSQVNQHPHLHRRLEPLGLDRRWVGLLDRLRHRSAGNRTSRKHTHAGPNCDSNPAPLNQCYSQAEIAYFKEIALGGEGGLGPAITYKWYGPIRLAVRGSSTQSDLDEIDRVAVELSSLTGLSISRVTTGWNSLIYFTTIAEYADIQQYFDPECCCLAHVSVWGRTIYRMEVWVGTEQSSTTRRHQIREEMTQGLGLLQDSWGYPRSAFYQGWSDTTEFAAIDRAIIRLLYEPEILPGMTLADLEALGL